MPLDRAAAKFLGDVLESAEFIAELTRGKTQDDFLKDRALRSAVQWNFMVIGEAINQLHQVNPEAAEQINEWHRIIGFRNQLIHGYGVIRDTITWDIIQDKVPILMSDVTRILKQS